MTFKETYQSLGNTPPKKAFIARMAKATQCSEFTVKMWVIGRQQPNAHAKSVIAQHLNKKVTELFPETPKDQNNEMA